LVWLPLTSAYSIMSYVNIVLDLLVHQFSQEHKKCIKQGLPVFHMFACDCIKLIDLFGVTVV